MGSPRASGTPKPTLPVWPEKVVGAKYVEILQKQLDRLREQDAHGNRKLFLDDVFIVSLLAFFNPTLRSLRTLEDFSQTRQAQKHLSIRKLCRSTLSDFHQLVDPVRLEPILNALRTRLERHRPQGAKASDKLGELLQQAVAVDGTFLDAVADVTWAIRCANQRRSGQFRVRLDCHLSVVSWLPEVIVVPEAGTSESVSAAAHVQEGRLYLYDRGFNGYGLINAHYEEREGTAEPRAHFVARYRSEGSNNTPSLIDTQDRPLTDADREAGVTSDREGRFQSSNPTRHALVDARFREVIVSRLDRTGQPQTIRLITNLLDVPADVIAHLYRHRWQIELFFRWLKCFANFDHLISHNRQAVQAHFHVAVIGILLMYLHNGYRPSKYLFALMSQVAGGGAELDEILPILQERERQSALARASARRRAEKKRSGT
jgi:hypothetical protein